MNIRILLIIIALALLFCAESATSQVKEVRIGVILHLTSDLSMQSAAFREGIELAAEHLSHERNSESIQIVVEDGRNSAPASYTATRKLVFSDKVSAVIVSSFLDAMADGPLLEKNGVPTLVLWDSSPEIDALGDYIFSIGPWIPSSGKVAATFAHRNRKAKTAVILKSEDPFSESAAATFTETFQQFGGRIVTVISVPPSETDYRTVIAKIKALNPDVLYSPVVSNIVPFYSQLQQQHLSLPVISCNAITPEHIQQSPSMFEGIYHTMIGDPKGPPMRKLAAGYQAKFKKPLTLPWFVATGFDAFNILAGAVKASDGTKKGIKEALYKIRNYPGAYRRISIGPLGSAPQEEGVYRIHAGKFERQPPL